MPVSDAVVTSALKLKLERNLRELKRTKTGNSTLNRNEITMQLLFINQQAYKIEM